MGNRFLTTRQAADLCSVTPDTVLKWIHSGYLPARRTAGGHHRIDKRDLEQVMMPSRPKPADSEPLPVRGFRYCWEHNGGGQVRQGCLECTVYLMRAQRCYELAKRGPEAGHAAVFCAESCESCDYYRHVKGEGVNVLVVTDDPELTGALQAARNPSTFNLRISSCEYDCSALINHFRPDFAVIDCSLGVRASRDMSNHLVQDPRIPFVRLVLAGNEKEFPRECEREAFARIQRPFTVQDIAECIKGFAEPHENVVENVTQKGRARTSDPI